jgi:hypothetical protein
MAAVIMMLDLFDDVFNDDSSSDEENENVACSAEELLYDEERLKILKPILFIDKYSTWYLCSGGIVWEMSYLFIYSFLSPVLSITIAREVGAGCGLLVGLGCHKSGTIAQEVIITETDELMNIISCSIANEI